MLFVRTTGNSRREREEEAPAARAGLHGVTLPWLHEHGVAVLASDGAHEAGGYAGISMPVHAVGIVAMGMPLIDDCDVEELAETCERLRRWEFLVTVSRLRWRGATGGAVNPIALF